MQTDSQAESSPASDASEESNHLLTAGGLLQQERQRLGLNEKEVADQLHITVHYVKALESNSYEKLPGAVFAKGYLKSYAILLGMDVEHILARYAEFSQQQKSDSEEATRLRARRKKDRNKPFVIVSLLVFVGGFLGLWLVNSYFPGETVTDAPSSANAVEDVEAENSNLGQPSEQQLTNQPQLTIQAEPEEDAVASAPEETLAPEASTAGLIETVQTTAQVLQPGIDVSSTPEEVADVAIETAASDSPAEIPQPVITQSVETQSEQPRLIAIDSIGDDILRISFTGESWVEVNDSESQQIYRDIREAGDILEITGSAPFNVLLGDAPFIQMSLNGDEIDLSSDIRIDNSARLTVGL